MRGVLPAPIVPVSILVIDSVDPEEPEEDEPVLLMLLVEPGNSELLLPLVLPPLPSELGNREVVLRLMGAEPDDPPPGVPPKPPPWEPPGPPCACALVAQIPARRTKPEARTRKRRLFFMGHLLAG